MPSNEAPAPTGPAANLDPIFGMIKENKIDEALEYIAANRLKELDCVDEHGTTPLQYAAFRGIYPICELLLSKGSDVNAKTHDQGYSAFMFAAISNHARIVSLLLERGADTEYTNRIGRTASQMAAFVNSNECVDLIKSYIPREALDYFTEIHSISETEPKLPKGQCVAELHKLLINSTNYSPVRILKAIKFAEDKVLLANGERCVRALEAFITKVFKCEETECPNDLLAFKLHYYKYLFEYLLAQRKALLAKQAAREKSAEGTTGEDELEAKLYEACIKKLLVEEEVSVKTNEATSTEKRMCRVFEEKFLREAIRQFPYKECALVRQMVTILAKTEVGASPSALYVITSCLNGQRFNGDADEGSDTARKALECFTCSQKSTTAKLCAHCRKVAYCDQFCQKMHWPLHKKETKEISV